MQDESGRDVVRCFVKGAPDQLLARATTVLDADLKPIDLNDDLRGNATSPRTSAWASRACGFWRRRGATFTPESFDPHGDLLQLMQELTALSLIGIVDPPRTTAKAAIETAKAAGIRVRMITGDHAVTAAGDRA